MENLASAAIGNGGDPLTPTVPNTSVSLPSTASNAPEPNAPGAIPVATSTQEQEISAGKKQQRLYMSHT